MTELRGRARQGGSTSGGSRTLANRMSEAMDRLGGMIDENIRGNHQREQASRQEAQRRENTTGSTAFRRYMSGVMRGGGDPALERRVESNWRNVTRGVRDTRPSPVNADARQGIQYANEASATDARVRDASVTEANPVANGAELTRGDGPGRRGVLQRPFTVRVDGQDVAISDNQRAVLSEYTREHPRAFPTFADWYNAISTIEGTQPEQQSVESIVMARRQWDNPEQGSGPRRGLEPPNASFTLDPAYVRARGDVNYSADYNYQNIDMGIDPETGQRRIVGQRTSPVRFPQGQAVPDAPESARRPITPEERLTAESELMRIVNRNQRERTSNRSRTLQRAADTNPNERQPVLDLPRQIADAVIARARLSAEVQNLRDTTGTTKADMSKSGDQKDGGSKQSRHGTLMTAQEVADEQAARQRAGQQPVDGVSLQDPGVDPFSREPILPIRPSSEGESGGSRTLQRLRQAGRATVGGVELQPTANGVRGRITW